MQHKETRSVSEIVAVFTSFLNHLIKRWLLLVIAVMIGIGIALFIYKIQKPKYNAVATFILEEKSVGGNGLAGIASQFGFNLGSLNSGESIFTGDNILNILKSKKVIRQVLLTTTEDSSKKTLADLYLEFNGIKKRWQKKPALADINYFSLKQPLTPIQDSVLNIVYESILKKNLATGKVSKQGTIYEVKVTAENSLFAKLLAERLVAEASKLYLDIKVGTAQQNIASLQQRSDSLLLLLNYKSYATAANQPLDVNPGIRTAIVPTEIANRDKTVLATLYAEVTKNLEASKLLLSQQTPVIQTLDKPGELLDDHKKGLAFLIIICIFASELIFISGIFFSFLWKHLNNESLEKNVTTTAIPKATPSIIKS